MFCEAQQRFHVLISATVRVKPENIRSPDSPVRSSAGSSSSSSWIRFLWRKAAVPWFLCCFFSSTAGHCDQLSPKLKERVKICSSPDSLFSPLTSPKPVRPADTPSLSQFILYGAPPLPQHLNPPQLPCLLFLCHSSSLSVSESAV